MLFVGITNGDRCEFPDHAIDSGGDTHVKVKTQSLVIHRPADVSKTSSPRVYTANCQHTPVPQAAFDASRAEPMRSVNCNGATMAVRTNQSAPCHQGEDDDELVEG